MVKGWVILVRNEKALFRHYHIVVIAVKLIYGTGIGHDVKDGSGLMESLLNSVKPLHVAVASLTVKLQIFAKSTKLPKLQIY